MTSPAGGSQYQQDVGAPGGPHGPKITSVFDFSAEALEQLAFWLEQRGLHIPVTNLLGYSQNIPQVAPAVLTSQTTASDTFTDLATVGPTLTGLSDGKYFLMYSAIAANNTAGDGAAISIQINATAASTDDEALAQTGTLLTTLVGWTQKTLSNGGNNTVTVKYARVTGGTASFQTRRLVAIRLANP